MTGSPVSDTSPMVIEAQDLTCVFSSGGMFSRQKAVALNNVSLSARKGESISIVGESGSGKTTLAMVLLGLQPVTAGSVHIAGKALSSYSRKELARVVQPVFQDPYSTLNPRQTIRSILTLPLIVHGESRNNGEKRMLQAMDAVGMAARHLDAFPSQLSGGQRQRIAIARALMVRPEILICDEPTSALDVSVQAQILNLLTDIRREFGLTYILITHNFSVAEYMADRVCVMLKGEIIEEAAAQDFFRSASHPYSRSLLNAIPTLEGVDR
ncbi:ABC transporter ATP-binding protein [Aureimonas fodinaquatilis]|nr:ABC transporter ATP-binding protein [Aureimonas fodinaquatilis]